MKIIQKPALILALLGNIQCAWAQAPAPADAATTAASAWNAFLQGNMEQALSAFRYLATLGISYPNPDANLALTTRDLGRHDEALTHWVKASLTEGAGGFIWNQRGWAYAAQQRLPEARDSFLRAVERSSTTADQAEAQLGLGMAARMGSQPRQALPPLRAALVQSPFAMSAVSYEAAKASSAAGDKYAAIAYLRQCATLDPLNIECLRELAEIHARTGENRSAWYVYLRLLALDPLDSQSARKARKLQEYIPGDPESTLPVRRLAHPLNAAEPQQGESDTPPAPSIRVALFTGADAKPATATRLFFMCSSNFKIIAASGDVVKDDGQAQHQWEISFRPENNIVELRDNARNIQYTTKQALRIVPGGRQASVLLKSVRFVNSVGVDIGDRELRGSIEVLPTPYGFKLVNEAGLEEYLYGVVSAALPHNSPSEAYKALAVAARTQALWEKAHRTESLERVDVNDAAPGLRYVGLSDEMREASAAVRETAGIVLTRNGETARIMQHDNCGGVTEDGARSGEADAAHLVSVSDGEKPQAPSSSPDHLEQWTHEYPAADRYCEASGLTPPVASRWLRILPAKDIAQRAERIRSIGAIRGLRAVRRSPSGRVQALEVIGSKDTLLLESAKAMADVLSPGSLRSTLFTVQPLMSGSKADRFILWGAGTGHGVGLCRAGTLGQASMGRKWPIILKHYFPDLQVSSRLASPAPTALAPARGPNGAAPQRRKPKNPHWKKK
ncbi:MAG TPA: hypothetical protein DEB40_08425 [Elusimicrobia bacterium]|nr:hypothetical protein [Elusimicrobiota bacterium]HBT61754.1 hypothetical protein [Elusimicrobiota bacterium]